MIWMFEKKEITNKNGQNICKILLEKLNGTKLQAIFDLVVKLLNKLQLHLQIYTVCKCQVSCMFNHFLFLIFDQPDKYDFSQLLWCLIICKWEISHWACFARYECFKTIAFFTFESLVCFLIFDFHVKFCLSVSKYWINNQPAKLSFKNILLYRHKLQRLKISCDYILQIEITNQTQFFVKYVCTYHSISTIRNYSSENLEQLLLQFGTSVNIASLLLFSLQQRSSIEYIMRLNRVSKLEYQGKLLCNTCLVACANT
eukprot:TRINITY_DN19163_c0_g1_i4.p1 TRINITY_DN19163_c0_g1~~TRINITY_DN19163_c0_g1_i4.p1  ORF type:complete len:257 (-),score=-11.30 TRINITY_DN19163_c0_g1_i4:118-888(-)